MDDIRLLQVSFQSHVAIRPTNTVTAPGLRAPAGQRTAALVDKPQADPDHAAANRARLERKRKKNADRLERKRLAGPQRLAILDQQAGPGKGAGKGQ